MIILGKIPVTWTAQDYESCNYQTHLNPYRGFTASGVQDKTKMSKELNIGLSICYNIPNTISNNLKHFNLLKMSLQLQKYSPGEYLPFHSDRYSTYKKFNKISKNKKIVRIILFLHDQQPGQQLWIEDQMYPGKAGDYVGWTDDTRHMAANLSGVNRFNLQITGVQ
jgi:hypothetical protein